MKFTVSRYLTDTQHALLKGGKVVWMGTVGAPIEDVDCDEAVVSQATYDRIKAATQPRSEDYEPTAIRSQDKP